MLVIQFPQVQTAIADRVLENLSEKLDGDITFEKIHFKPFNTLVLKNTVITDRNPVIDPIDSTKPPVDTFFRAQYIIARFTLEGLIKQEGIHLDKAFISNAQMNLVLEDKADTTDGKTRTENLSRIFKIRKKKVKPEPSEKELFHIRKIEIHDMGFSLKNYSRKKVPFHGGICWDDLDVSDINVNARELQFKGGIMYGSADKISFREKSGYSISSISGKVKVGCGKTVVEDIWLADPWSDMHLPLFMMSYSCARDFKDFVSSVKLDGEIAPDSRLDFRTISYFAPQLEGNDLKLAVSGSMSGPVDDFTISDISIISQTGGFSGTVNGRICGLPDIRNTFIDAELDNFHFTSKGLGGFISEWMPREGIDFSDYAKGFIFMLDADARGRMNNLGVKARLSSMIGKARADVSLTNLLASGKPAGISGGIHTEDLDLKAITGKKILGPVSLNAFLDVSLGGKDATFVRIDTLTVERMHINGYDYSGITATGDLSKNSCKGTVLSHDPSLNLFFDGGFALSSKTDNSVYEFTANVGHADLNAMNLDRRGRSEISFETMARFTKTGEGDFIGKIDLGKLNLTNDDGRHDIGNIVLTSDHTDGSYHVDINSSFADAAYTGTAPVGSFVNDLKNITLKKELPALFKDSAYVWKGNSYRLDFICHNSQDLLSFLMPGLYINEGTALAADIDKDGRFKASVNSDRLAYGTNYLKDLNADIDNGDNNFNGAFQCSEIQIATLRLNDNSLEFHADSNHIGAKYSYENHGELINMGELIVNGDFSRDEDILKLNLGLKPSKLYFNSREWQIHPSEMSVTGNDIAIRSFNLSSGDQNIRIEGGTSRLSTDTLQLNLERFDISVLNSVLKKDFGIRGALTGTMELTSPTDIRTLMIDLLCDSTYVGDVPMGILHVGSTWDGTKKAFDLKADSMIEGRKCIDVTGKFMPKSRRLEAGIKLERFNIGHARPFLTDIFSDMKGYISGGMTMNGPVDRLDISSDSTMLEDANLTVAFTNVPYHAEGPFHINSRGVYFDDISIRDRFNGTGSVSGSIDYDHFRDIRFNTIIKADGIEAVNLPEDTGMGFYGNLFGTGNISITGPVHSMLMNIDAVTSKAGQLHIPLSNTLKAKKGTNLLKFKEIEKHEAVDPYELFIRKSEKKKKSGSEFTVKLKVNASPEVEAFVEIDRSTGNVLSGRGTGTIDLEAGKDIFNINGDYNLNSGNYKFVALGMVSRDFQIQDGSSIRFNGDIMDSSLDIDAIYKTKAALSTLIADTTSVATRRVVECGINITDKISNPRLNFSIRIPDLDPMVESRVSSALSTEDKVQKQFLSLVISNNFLPDEQSGIVNNSSVLYSNVTEILANQLNNIFHKLDIPVDMGLNYQPNERGNDIFDVAVSTQLFNNRVVVNGNIGNKQYTSETSSNGVVGDLDIEIKLDRSGSFRLNIFSHSADQYTNFLDNSQRNGVGLTYQTEFNNFGQFVKNIFSRKEKRQAAKKEEEMAILEGGRKEIIVKPQEKAVKRKKDE